MKNYIIQKDGFETVIQSESLQMNNETGQTFFWSKEKDRVTAIIPKECIIIETQYLTEYQKTLQSIIEDLEIVKNNDFERIHPSSMELEDWKKAFQLSWLNYFKRLYNDTIE